MSSHPQSKFAQFPFGGSMNEAVDPRLIEPPQVISAKNVRVHKSGGYEKRYGSSVVADTFVDPSWADYAIEGAGRGELSPLGDTLVHADPQHISVLSPARGNALLWRGHAPLGMPRKRSLYSNTLSFTASASVALSQFANVDCAAGTLASGKKCVAAAWTNNNVMSIAVFDSETFVPINTTFSGNTMDPVFMSAAYSWPRLMWLGNDLYCLAHAKTTNNLALLKLTTSTWTWSVVQAAVVNNARNSAPRAWFDCHAFTSTTFVLAYQDTANALKVLAVTTGGATAATVTSAEPAASLDAIGVYATNDESVWVTYVVNASGQARVTNIVESTWAERASFPMSVSGGGSQAFCSGSVRLSPTQQAVFFSRYDGSTEMAVHATRVTTAAAEDANPVINENVMMTGKPLIDSNRVFVPCVWGGTGRNAGLPWGTSAVQFSSGLLQFWHDRPTAAQFALMPGVTVIPRVASSPGMHLVGSTGNLFAPCSTVIVDNTWFHVWPEVRGIVGKNAARESLELHSYDTAASTFLKGQRLGPTCHLAGLGVDSAFVYEQVPLSRPESITVADSAGAGTQAAGTYRYRVVYVFSTATGQVVRSAPSDDKEYVAPGLKSAVVTIPLPPATYCWRPDANFYYVSFYAEVYRSTNAAQSGPYYYVGRTTPMFPSGSGTTYTDNAADATIATYPKLYTGDVGTTRAAMANVAPPTFVSTVVHKDRVFGLDPDRHRIWVSDKLVSGEMPAFHDEVTLVVDDDLVCLFSMDETIGAFSERAVYAMQGEGPSFKFPGADSDYQGFRRVASDVGCVDAGSPCLLPEGVFFRAQNGLAIFSRSGQVMPFGNEVRDLLASYTLRTSAALHPSQRWLYVACDNGETGICLVYDYLNKSWSYDQRALGQANDRMHSLCTWNDAVHFIAGSDGEVWKEDTSTYLDGSSFVARSVVCAPFKGAGPQGWQGTTYLYFLGYRATAHGMSATIDYDHSTARTETVSWTDSEISAFENSAVVQWRRQLGSGTGDRENQSVRVTWTETAPTVGATGTGQGATWIAWGVDHELKKEPAHLAAAQQK